MPKFLVLARLGAVQPAPDEVPQATDAVRTWVREQQGSGRLDVAYTYPEGGGCAIFDTDSAEELQELLVANPASAFLRYSVHPLIDLDIGLARLLEIRGGGETW
jgi:muconolactone delta-isomerase